MSTDGKVAFVKSKGYELKNDTWSWGATGPDGILLLVSNEKKYSQYLGKGRALYWLWGGHEQDTDAGGVERKRHIDEINAGTPAKAAYYTPDFTSGKEKIASIAPELWRVLEIREPDEQGRIYALLEKEMPR